MGDVVNIDNDSRSLPQMNRELAKFLRGLAMEIEDPKGSLGPILDVCIILQQPNADGSAVDINTINPGPPMDTQRKQRWALALATAMRGFLTP